MSGPVTGHAADAWRGSGNGGAAARTAVLTLPLGHAHVIHELAVSADGRVAATASDDASAKVFEVETWRELRTVTGHAGPVLSAALSGDGTLLVTAGRDGTVRLRDVASTDSARVIGRHDRGLAVVRISRDGRTVVSADTLGVIAVWDADSVRRRFTLQAPLGKRVSLSISPDARILAVNGYDSAVHLWSLVSGTRVAVLRGHADVVTRVSFSHDGRHLVSTSYDRSVRVWDVATRANVRTVRDSINWIAGAELSPDGRTIVSIHGSHLRRWDASTGAALPDLTGPAQGLTAMAMHPDGRMVLAVGWDCSVHRWSLETGVHDIAVPGSDGVRGLTWDAAREALIVSCGDTSVVDIPLRSIGDLRRTAGFTRPIWGVSHAPKTRLVAAADLGGTVRVLEAATWAQVAEHRYPDMQIHRVAFSPDGTLLAMSGNAGRMCVIEVQTGAVRWTARHRDTLRWMLDIAWSRDGRTIFSTAHDSTVQVWDASSGRLVRLLRHPAGSCNHLAVSPLGSRIVANSSSGGIAVWEPNAADPILIIRTPSEGRAVSFAISGDDSRLYAGMLDGSICVFSLKDGTLLGRAPAHTGSVAGCVLLYDDHLLATAGDDGRIRLWRLPGLQELATIVPVRGGQWLTTVASGLFDASPGGMDGMYYVVGLEWIELRQLKERYYEPGLLAKLLDPTSEPLRNVSGFDAPRLFPELRVDTFDPAQGHLVLTAIDRGGGIGRIQVFVNDKEVAADARGHATTVDGRLRCSVSLARAPVRNGQPNTIRIVAWNAEEYLSSRGHVLIWTPDRDGPDIRPSFHAVVVGVSNYSNEQFHLRYAAKDAEDFASAVTIGATRLFGRERTHVTVLSSHRPPSQRPTKANIQRVFSQLQSLSPDDVLLVYFAGHGKAVERGAATYCLLTEDAFTINLTDAAIRERTTITSDELGAWVNSIPALHLALVLDACNAGAAADKLSERRDIPSEQRRAFDRLTDNTSFYVLMACNADAVSYESNSYAQGLLTYSLLKGMKGAKLRNDEFVDVAGLFHYAQDQVPELARNIGGVQKPMIIAPRANSFDIGQLTAEDRRRIPLALPRPLLVKPTIIDGQQLYDVLGVQARLRKSLLEAGAASDTQRRGSAVAYVDVDEFDGAMKVSGTYQTKGTAVHVRLVLLRNGRPVGTIRLNGDADNLDTLIARCTDAILTRVQALGTPVQARSSESDSP